MTQENEPERWWTNNVWVRPYLSPSWVQSGHDVAHRVQHCLAEGLEILECVVSELEPLLEALAEGIGSMPGI